MFGMHEDYDFLGYFPDFPHAARWAESIGAVKEHRESTDNHQHGYQQLNLEYFASHISIPEWMEGKDITLVVIVSAGAGQLGLLG